MSATNRVLVGLSAVVLLAGCTAVGGDKAGGPGEPVVLTLASGPSGLEYAPPVEYFVNRVAEVSHGRLKVNVANEWGHLAADMDHQLVRDVAAGKADLGWVATRFFDSAGVTDLQALTAPMLIDNYALQGAVIGSDIPGDMLPGLQPLGVTGLAVLAGPIRRPAAVKRPLLGPANWRGIVVSMAVTSSQQDAIKALGATPVTPGITARDDALAAGEIDAVEVSLLTYQLNGLAPRVPHMTANVQLWPTTIALLAGSNRWSQLTKDQRAWLSTAAADAATRSATLADSDADLAAQACTSGARFTNASAADLEALRRAFAPAYASLSQDPRTKSFIERILALKASTPREPPLAIPANCPGVAPATVLSSAAGQLDGVYRWTLSVDDARRHGTANDQRHLDDWYPTTFTVTLRRGTWEAHQTADSETGSGTFVVTGDRITFDWPEEHLVIQFRYAAGSNGDLTLTPILPMNPGDQFVWSTHTWTKIA